MLLSNLTPGIHYASFGKTRGAPPKGRERSGEVDL